MFKPEIDRTLFLVFVIQMDAEAIITIAMIPENMTNVQIANTKTTGAKIQHNLEKMHSLSFY